MTDTHVWLELLYTEHQQRLFAFLLRRTGDWHLAQDLTSATFLRALNSADSYTDTNPAAWLQRIATNLMLDHYRSAYHRHITFLDENQYSELDGDEPRQPFYEKPDPDSDPAVVLIDKWDQQRAADEQAHQLARILAAVAGLRSVQQRRVIELYLRGFDISATSAALGISPSAAKARRVRAFLALRIELGVGAAA